jgi:hypothetical protein
MDKIYDLFSNIVKVDENPATFITTEVFKINGKLKTIQKKEKFDLIKPDGDLIESIMNRMLNSSEREKLDFYPSNFIQKIFGKKMIKKFKDIDSDCYIIANERVSKNVVCNNIIIDNTLNDVIILGRKDIIILKDDEYFFNIENYKVYELY